MWRSEGQRDWRGLPCHESIHEQAGSAEEIGGENIPQRAVRAAEERPLVENGA